MHNAVPDKRYCLSFFTRAPSGRRVIPAYLLLDLFVRPFEAPDFPHLFSHHRLLIWPFIASNLVSMSGNAARTHDVRCFIGCLLALHYRDHATSIPFFIPINPLQMSYVSAPLFGPFLPSRQQAHLTPSFLGARMAWHGMGWDGMMSVS